MDKLEQSLHHTPNMYSLLLVLRIVIAGYSAWNVARHWMFTVGEVCADSMGAHREYRGKEVIAKG